ncbi:MAG: DUF2282 domain-containing protein [Gammaproteobacteria bacterium]|nr:DUF2282 domain-containing protein [Gammaproteobacteria bacterium]
MRDTKTLVNAALTGLLALSAVAVAGTATAAPAMGQKCYGINAVHQNGCKTVGHACKGQDAKARDPNAFVELPKGVCAKIDGGSLTPGA